LHWNFLNSLFAHIKLISCQCQPLALKFPQHSLCSYQAHQ
jgi:hypothetical protein